MQGVDHSRPLRVFLCHSSDDKPAVRELCRKLRSEDVDPWLDEKKLLPGQDWNREITNAVRDSDVVIVCLSNNSINKAGYIQKEIKNALDVADEQPEGTIFLIPLKLEECDVPQRLERWQWVNYFDEKGYDRLMLALQTRVSELGLAWKAERIDSDLQASQDQRAKVAPKQEFRVRCTYFYGARREVRQDVAGGIAKMAPEFTLNDVIEFSRSALPGERVGAAILLRTKIHSSLEVGQEQTVIQALRELLQDSESRVRYRAVEAIGVNPELVTTFRKNLERIMETDDNSAVRKAAGRTLG